MTSFNENAYPSFFDFLKRVSTAPSTFIQKLHPVYYRQEINQYVNPFNRIILQLRGHNTYVYKISLQFFQISPVGTRALNVASSKTGYWT